jgi:hypothetical protein
MRFGYRLGLAFSLTLAVACSAPVGDPAAGDSLAEKATMTAPLDAASFRDPLTKAFVKGTHALGEPAFAAKWSASLLDTPLMFLRAYPAAFHADLKRLPEAAFPGTQGICVGDAHPDNFGYLSVDKKKGGTKAIYAFNDLDDSGYCLASIDALRYFTAFRLVFDEGQLAESLDEYATYALAKDPVDPAKAAATALSDKDEPDFAKVRAKNVKKYTDEAQTALVFGSELEPVGEAISKTVRALIGASVKRVLEVGRRPREAGGSGGLLRYWALVELAEGDTTILELKQAATPAVDFGYSSPKLSGPPRLVQLKQALWGVTEADYAYVTWPDGPTFLVRDRGRKKSVDTNDDQRKAQARYLGALHQGRWAASSPKQVKNWLEASSNVLATRWQAFYVAEKGQ